MNLTLLDNPGWHALNSYHRQLAGGALTTQLARQILDRGETPFLHHVTANEGAARLYRKLGFRQRTLLPLAILPRTKTTRPA